MYAIKHSNIYILILILLITNCISLLSIPFKSINLQKKEKSNFFIEALSNEIYINLTLSHPSLSSGKSKDYIKALLKIDKNSFYLPEEQLSDEKIIEKNHFMYVSWAMSMLYMANDSFCFNILNGEKTKSVNILNFLTRNGINSYENLGDFGMIGLRLYSNSNETKNPDFIKELKREKIINGYKWSIKYNYIKDNYYEGEFLLGNDIEQYYKREKDEDFRMVKAANRKYELYWDIKFKEIKIGEKSLNINNIGNKNAIQGTFEPKINIIIGPNDFRYEILNQFFNKNIYLKICSEEKISINAFDYIGIKCKKTLNITEFPNISFKLQFYSFTFGYKDLFHEDENYFYFLIVFNQINYYEENNEFWIFGVPFINKYIFIFDSDSKTITYFNKKKIDSFEKNNNNNIDNDIKSISINNNTDNNSYNNSIEKTNINIIIIIGVIILCSGLLILFGMKIQKIVLKRRFPTLNLNGRKKHKNELSCELECMQKDKNLLTSDQ